MAASVVCVQNDEFMFIFSSPEPGGLVVLMQVCADTPMCCCRHAVAVPSSDMGVPWLLLPSTGVQCDEAVLKGVQADPEFQAYRGSG